MKSCLVLSGFPNIAFKVDNYSSTNMVKIEQKWETGENGVKDIERITFTLDRKRDTLKQEEKR